jgi:hypothetical protein
MTFHVLAARAVIVHNVLTSRIAAKKLRIAVVVKLRVVELATVNTVIPALFDLSSNSRLIVIIDACK